VTKPLLILRADASASVGAGHVMRCLSVAERWIEAGGRAVCWGDVELQFVRRRAESLGVPIVAHPGMPGSVLLVDVYGEDERRSLATSSAAARRVLVDDLGESVPRSYHAVWNPNAYGDANLYPGFSGEVIAGEDCVPIRCQLPRWIGDGPGAVSFGGGQIPTPLRSALSQFHSALGVNDGWGVGESLPPGWQRVNEDDSWSDLQHAAWLITAAGSTLWEAAAVGIPVVVVVFADNQALAGSWAAQHGAPVLDVRDCTDPAEIAADIATAVRGARPLPFLRSGAAAVARSLRQLSA
jgi:UDP-2,4-diacetamido-2,4,6-trideoxy-beta-L-altropyranose hydrolase